MPDDWGIHGKCPHGREVLLYFDAMGYIRKPTTCPCDATQQIAQKPAPPGRFRVWRETRKFRKALHRNRDGDANI